MIQDRDSARLVFVEVWQKYQQNQPLEPLQELILSVILEHPEYQAILDKGQESVKLDFSPEAGVTNPFLHMGMHITIKEQVQADRPAGIMDLYQVLSVKFSDQHALEHEMMECLGEVLWNAQRDNTMPDENAYLDSLKRLA